MTFIPISRGSGPIAAVDSEEKSPKITFPPRGPVPVQVSDPIKPRGPIQVENWRRIPVYIINHNRFNIGFLELVDWLVSIGMEIIKIVDNGSSYPPLLEYYEKCGLYVYRFENYGPWSFWDRGLSYVSPVPYIVTDSDVVPDKDCPKDLIPKMIEIFKRYSDCLKVGPGLRINNIPDHYGKKKEVLELEGQSWELERLVEERDAYKTEIDTTFALYFTQYHPSWNDHYRLAPPYLVEHKPWYQDSSNPTEEDIYFKEHMRNGWSHW